VYCVRLPVTSYWQVVGVLFGVGTTKALNDGDGTPQLEPYNGWKILEVISEGDNPNGDYEMPHDFDGLGAWLIVSDTLRFLINHETMGDSTISEVNVNVSALQSILVDMMHNKAMLGAKAAANVSFVTSARQAFDRFSTDLGDT
jgi:hypothetical protein